MEEHGRNWPTVELNFLAVFLARNRLSQSINRGSTIFLKQV